jgi:hypothetical protein
MPVGDPIEIYFTDPEVVTLEWDRFGFFDAEIIAPDNLIHPILQIHHNNRTISPLGSFSGNFFSEELKNALKFGYKIIVNKGVIFQRANIFKGWVNDQYKLRLEHPKGSPMNFIAKILLNSLYGRFGMKDDLGFFSLLTDKEFTSLLKSESSIEEVISFRDKHLVKFKSDLSLDEEIDSPFNNINIAIASAVTAYARIHMSQFKNNSNFPNLYYSDTDSLYFDGPIPDKYISNRLGALKLEGEYSKAIFLAPKVYGYLTKEGKEVIKIKGLSSEAIKENNITLETLASLLRKGSSYLYLKE